MLESKRLSVGVVGCGNMASAIARGMHASNPRIDFKTYTPSRDKAVKLASEVHGQYVESLEELAECDVIFIGCKPQQFDVLEDNLVAAHLDKHYFVSMMAAMSFDRLARKLTKAKFSRVMPNTPIKKGEGVTLLLSDSSVTSEKHEMVKELFSLCSLVQEVISEEQLDDITVISGGGPAYLFYFAHCLQLELSKMGLGEKDSSDMVAKLFLGVGKLMQEREHYSYEQLLDQVTSKGGVTIEAIKVFKSMQMQEMISKALEKAKERSIEMSRSL